MRWRTGDHYEILGVARDADERTIRSAYRRLVRRYHPDLAGEGTTSRFLMVRHAYEVLSDPETRREYDRQISAATSGPRPARDRRSAGFPSRKDSGIAAPAEGGLTAQGSITILSVRVDAGARFGIMVPDPPNDDDEDPD